MSLISILSQDNVTLCVFIKKIIIINMEQILMMCQVLLSCQDCKRSMKYSPWSSERSVQFYCSHLFICPHTVIR